jgi:hypothetical protein
MKAKLFLAVCFTLIVANQTFADGLWTSLGRSLGYGIGDGYHSQRCCGASVGSWQAQPYAPPPAVEWSTPRQMPLRMPLQLPSPAPYSPQPEVLPQSDAIPPVIPQPVAYPNRTPSVAPTPYFQPVQPQQGFFPPAPMTRRLSSQPSPNRPAEAWPN